MGLKAPNMNVGSAFTNRRDSLHRPTKDAATAMKSVKTE